MMKPAISTDVTDVVLNVFRLNGRLIAAGDALVAPLGMTSARWQVIGAIASLGQAPVPRIAETMGLTRQSVQRIADELEALGIVAFAANPHHKRAKLIKLTAKGAGLYDETLQLQVPWAKNLGKGIDPRHLQIARDVLTQLRRRLETDSTLGEPS